jgi:hypothetical protein
MVKLFRNRKEEWEFSGFLKRNIAWYGTCGFEITNRNAGIMFAGGGDIVFQVERAISQFGREPYVGGRGDMHCP